MKTLLVHGRDPVPADLREIIQRGSTSLDEVTTGELSTFVSQDAFGVDRIVFWVGQGDPEVRGLALNYAAAAGEERQQTIVFISARPSEPAVDGMTREEVFVWPTDADKLKVVFMTGG